MLKTHRADFWFPVHGSCDVQTGNSDTSLTFGLMCFDHERTGRQETGTVVPAGRNPIPADSSTLFSFFRHLQVFFAWRWKFILEFC